MTEHAQQIAVQGMPWSREAVWWVVLVEGLVAILLGLYLVLAPTTASARIAQLIGLYVLVMGGLSVYRGFQVALDHGVAFQLMRGAIGVTVGLLTCLPPLFVSVKDNLTATVTLLFILATGLTLQGLVGLWGVYRLRNEGLRGAVVLGALLRLLVGLLLYLQIVSGASYALAIGLAAIIVGAVLVLASLLLRRSQVSKQSSLA